MKHWNYKVVVIEKVEPGAMETLFQQHDALGWELVSVAQVPLLSLVAVFRKARD